MNLKQSLSWKILLPIGIILWVIGYGGFIGLLGIIMTLMGIIDLGRTLIRKRKEKKLSEEEK